MTAAAVVVLFGFGFVLFFRCLLAGRGVARDGPVGDVEERGRSGARSGSGASRGGSGGGSRVLPPFLSLRLCPPRPPGLCPRRARAPGPGGAPPGRAEAQAGKLLVQRGARGRAAAAAGGGGGGGGARGEVVLSSSPLAVAVLVERLERPAGALTGLPGGPGGAALRREAPEEVVERPRGRRRGRSSVVVRRRRGVSPASSPAVSSPREEGIGFGDFEEARGGAADVRVVPEKRKEEGR